MQAITRTFLKGLAAVLPITITIYAVVWLVRSAEEALKGLLPGDVYFRGLGILVGLALVYLIGLLLNMWIAAALMRLIDRLLEHIPLVKSLYGSVKDLGVIPADRRPLQAQPTPTPGPAASGQ